MSISRTSPPTWRQPRTLAILFWTGFGFAPFSALLLLVGDSGVIIKLALIAGLGSVVLIGLSIALRTDATTVERDLNANMNELETETRRALRELRHEVRHGSSGHDSGAAAVASAAPRQALPYDEAVASAAPRQALPYEEADDQRRPHPTPHGASEYYQRRGDERSAGAYVSETTAVPRQRWEDDYPPAEREPRVAARQPQAMEAWRADAPSSGARRSRAVEDGWADEVYNSGSTPRSRGAAPDDAAGGRGRHYRDDEPVSGDIPRRSEAEPTRRREYASESRYGGNSSYMDTYYGQSRR